MEVWNKCNQDENVIYERPFGDVNAALVATNIAYPTETYYPPGEYKSHDKTNCIIMKLYFLGTIS